MIQLLLIMFLVGLGFLGVGRRDDNPGEKKPSLKPPRELFHCLSPSPHNAQRQPIITNRVDDDDGP